MTPFTFEEILQQPAMWQKTAQRMATYRESLTTFLQPVLSDDSARIILTGAGSSAFAGLTLAPYLSQVLDRRVEAIATTDIVSSPSQYLVPDVPTLLVSFARSGNSPESIAATKIADQILSNCYQLVITCAEDGILAMEHRQQPRSFVILTPPETNDRGFAMTSSFTSMSLAAMLAFCPEMPVDSLVAGVSEILDRRDDIRNLAQGDFNRVIFLGSGTLAGAAKESALKTLELTAGTIDAYFDSPLGFRHGPKSLAHPGALTVVYLSENAYTRTYDLDLVHELKGDGAQVVAISLQPDMECPDTQWTFAVPAMTDGVASLLFVVFAQLLAVYSSQKLGLNTDNPFPGGEVNRVVQGVRIHPLP